MNWWIAVPAFCAGSFTAGFIRAAWRDFRRWQQRQAEVGKK